MVFTKVRAASKWERLTQDSGLESASWLGGRWKLAETFVQ